MTTSGLPRSYGRARYRLIATMRKGGILTTEVHPFGRLAPDGRPRSATQNTRTLRADTAAA